MAEKVPEMGDRRQRRIRSGGRLPHLTIGAVIVGFVSGEACEVEAPEGTAVRRVRISIDDEPAAHTA